MNSAVLYYTSSVFLRVCYLYLHINIDRNLVIGTEILYAYLNCFLYMQLKWNVIQPTFVKIYYMLAFVIKIGKEEMLETFKELKTQSLMWDVNKLKVLFSISLSRVLKSWIVNTDYTLYIHIILIGKSFI